MSFLRTVPSPSTPPTRRRGEGASSRPRPPAAGRAGAETSFERILEKELDRLVEGDPSLGDEGRITRWRRLVRGLLDAIERGDGRAAKLIFDRTWPATKQEARQAIERYFDAQDLEA